MPKAGASQGQEASYVDHLRYLSPLRYPGGKARLVDFIERLIHGNGLQGCHYIEPYAGGAGLAIGLLQRRAVSHVHLNDLDRSVFAFWHTVLEDTDWLCNRIESCDLSMEEWFKQRSVQRGKSHVSLRCLGFSTFYLNRTNRSGIIRSGGPIGGLEQAGKWALGARFNRDDLIHRIRRIAGLRSQISISNLDALALIQRRAGTLPDDSLFYFDPPYFVKGRRRLYANSYSADDHALIAELLGILPWPWVISYDPAPEILQLYRQHQKRAFTLEYSASTRCKGTETIFFAPILMIPSRWSPELGRSTLPNVA